MQSNGHSYCRRLRTIDQLQVGHIRTQAMESTNETGEVLLSARLRLSSRAVQRSMLVAGTGFRSCFRRTWAELL